MSAIIEILKPILVPVIVEVVLRLMKRFEEKPELESEAKEVLKLQREAKSREERIEASKRLHDFSRRALH